MIKELFPTITGPMELKSEKCPRCACGCAPNESAMTDYEADSSGEEKEG